MTGPYVTKVVSDPGGKILRVVTCQPQDIDANLANIPANSTVMEVAVEANPDFPVSTKANKVKGGKIVSKDS